jgi:hypothetical protein
MHRWCSAQPIVESNGGRAVCASGICEVHCCFPLFVLQGSDESRGMKLGHFVHEDGKKARVVVKVRC